MTKFIEIPHSLSDIINNSQNLYFGHLREYFKILFRENRGNTNSYHGIRHILHVLTECYDALSFYKGKISSQEGRSLLIASIFHDFSHSGRSGNDDLNIELALRAFDKYCLESDRSIAHSVQKLITLTEFAPTGHVKQSTTELEKILRDADLSQICSTHWVRIILFGLSEESKTSPEDTLKTQESFLSNVQFESEWGKQKFGNAIKEKIEEAKELVKILESC